jgi:transposase
MINVCSLSDQEKKKLKQMTRQQIGRVSQRAHMILLSSQGRTIQEIAAMYDCSDKTVRKWISRYEAEGCDGLLDKPRTGRPAIVDEKVKAAIEEDMKKLPSDFGYIAAFWTVGLLCIHLVKTAGIKVSNSTVRRCLHALDYAFNRPRIAANSNDPEAGIKVHHIAQTMINAPENAVFLCEDESTFRLLPFIRSMWMKVGQQLRIVVPSGWNKCFRVFGALNIRTGAWHYRIFDKACSSQFISFLSDLLKAYPNSPIYVILDNGSIHTSQETQDWLSLHPRLQLLYLPKRSPQMNPVEKIWWECKKSVASNRYLSMARLKQACHDFFASVSANELLRLTSLAA